MARRSEGIKLERRDSGMYYARFTYAGRRYNVSTGERESGAAQTTAARIFRDIGAGLWAPGGRRIARISDYDFRHSAATQLGRSSDNLPGVMYLLGHKQPATTAR